MISLSVGIMHGKTVAKLISSAILSAPIAAATSGSPSESLSGFSFDNSFDARESLCLVCARQVELFKQFSIYTGLRWEGIVTSSHGNDYANIQNRSGV